MKPRLLLQLSLGLCAFVMFESSAWCSRVNSGGSGLGTMPESCQAGSGPASTTTFSGVSVTCSSTDSLANGAFPGAILDFHPTSGAFSTFSTTIDFPDGVGNYGVVVCPNDGITSACTNVSLANANLITIVPDPSAGLTGAVPLTIGNGANVSGDIVLYFDSPADVTAASATSSSSPEPTSIGLLGFGIVAVSLFAWRRLLIKS